MAPAVAVPPPVVVEVTMATALAEILEAASRARTEVGAVLLVAVEALSLPMPRRLGTITLCPPRPQQSLRPVESWCCGFVTHK